jgi:mannobiose 2-epimerase
VLGNKDLIEEVRTAAVRLSDAALEGYREDGSMVYESDPVTGHTDTDRHWWVQAETVVGCLNRARISGDGEWAERAIRTWDFIRDHLLAPDGEWYWSIREDGSPNLDEDRAGFWKCPYHNGRMCLEIIENY